MASANERRCAEVSAERGGVSDSRPYASKVFIAPPWPAIFEQDAERKQTLVEAEATYHAMVEAYAGFGYELVSLPLAPVAERAAFVRGQIA